MKQNNNDILEFIQKYSQDLPLEAIVELKKIAEDQDCLKKAFDYNPCTICVIDEDDNYLNANSKMLDMMKINEESLLGKKVGSLTKDPTMTSLIKELKESSEETIHKTIEFNVGGQNKVVWLTANKVGPRILTTGLDITDLRQLEEEKQFNEKLALLGEMSSFIVHEINNPLSTIVMANELIEVENIDSTDNQEIQKYVNQIKTMTLTIQKIIESLKSVVRKDTNQNLNNSIQEILEKSKIVLSGKIKKNHILIIENNLSDSKIFGSEIHLIQVMVNLLSNTIDAIQDLEEKWIKVSWDNGCLKITDSGKGISEAGQVNLFKKHYTSKGQKGNGIGLYLSRDLLKKMGYSLIYKLEGQNTSFQWVPESKDIAA